MDWPEELARGAPPGWTVAETDRGVGALAPDVPVALLESALSVLAGETVGRGGSAGRGDVPFLDLPPRTDRAPGQAAVRPYRRGGILRAILPARFPGPSRALHEARLLEEALSRGVPTARPLLVAGLPVGRGRLRLALATLVIPDALDLPAWLAGPGSSASAARRARVAEACGRAVHALHEAGIEHGDLHLKNLLVREPPSAGPEAFVIDLDRASTPDRVDREGNLLRLDRSAEKGNLRTFDDAARILDRDRARCLRASLPDDREARRRVARKAERARRGRVVRRILWRLGVT